jgi:hypothetical protein
MYAYGAFGLLGMPSFDGQVSGKRYRDFTMPFRDGNPVSLPVGPNPEPTGVSAQPV